eukprot:748200-Hanusia_phi.AAC.1
MEGDVVDCERAPVTRLPPQPLSSPFKMMSPGKMRPGTRSQSAQPPGCGASRPDRSAKPFSLSLLTIQYLTDCCEDIEATTSRC